MRDEIWVEVGSVCVCARVYTCGHCKVDVSAGSTL